MNKPLEMSACILIAEDDPVIAMGLSKLLEAKYKVLVANEGEQALVMVLEQQPDLVLLDINLPGRTGISVCQKARENGFRNPVLMVSARSDQVDKVIGLESGADDYITKPYDSRELIARIEAHLRRRAQSAPQEHSCVEVSSSAVSSSGCKLLTVMFMNMIGFSGSIIQDEPATRERLMRYRETSRKLVEQYAGRVVHSMGSGFLITFDSAVSASHCALAMLSTFGKRNVQDADDVVHIRVGMHFGEVWFEGDNASGETVNIAARLQQMAEADTVFISSTLYSTIRKHIQATVVPMGAHTLKNIREPVSIVRLTPKPAV